MKCKYCGEETKTKCICGLVLCESCLAFHEMGCSKHFRDCKPYVHTPGKYVSTARKTG